MYIHTARCIEKKNENTLAILGLRIESPNIIAPCEIFILFNALLRRFYMQICAILSKNIYLVFAKKNISRTPHFAKK